jgi:hypothetical protein
MAQIISSFDIDSQYEKRSSRNGVAFAGTSKPVRQALATNSKQPKPRYLTLG